MMKITSIASRHSHHSYESLSVAFASSTESGIFSMAMDNEIDHASELNPITVTSLDNKRTYPVEDSSGTVEPASKRVKVESVEQSVAFSSTTCDDSEQKTTVSGEIHGIRDTFQPASNDVNLNQSTSHLNPESGESSIVTSSSQSSHASASNASLQDATSIAAKGPIPNPTTESSFVSPTSPFSHTQEKATTMKHLREKYLSELEYMLREFRKLERQLLGAKGAAQLEESAGSRERREKLHSFILHLEDTVRQIEVGCSMEEECTGPSIGGTPGGQAGVDACFELSAAIPASTKDDEEAVQKLEEHILANLLPVKIRLKKQLAAQQGATRNPPGMPAPRRGSLQPAALGKGTFAAAAEERRKQAEAARLAAQQEEHVMRRATDPSQFGKPLGGGGSSLTQKLHGATLGCKQRIYGHGVGSTLGQATPGDTATPDRKILYAGMVPNSTQHQSSIIAASGVHDLIVEDPNFIDKQDEIGEADILTSAAPEPATAQSAVCEVTTCTDQLSPKRKEPQSTVPDLAIETTEKIIKSHEDFTLSEDERRKLRKRRRKRKLLRIARRRERERQRQLAIQQQAQAAQGSAKAAAGKKKAAANKPQGKKKGPKSVEYMCALCSETYTSTCDYNPWWALSQHECPKCRKTQIPRIDISAPANAIDYHPALLAHADENNGAGGEGSSESTSVHIVHITQPSPPFKTSQLGDQGFIEGIDSDSESDLSELSDGSLSEESSDSDDSEMDFQAMSQAEQAEHECFGQEYKGPTLSDDHAARLLVLMAHASTCPCRHKLTKHRDVCMSTKYMMLHVRDCPGTTASFDVCPFPWCRKVKHLLYHLVSCVDPVSCAICSPKHLSDSLRSLSGLNEFRLKKHRQCILAAAKTARSKGVPLPNARPATQKPTQRKELDISRSVTQPAKPLTPQKIDTTAPMSVSAAQTTATLSSTSTKTATSLPTELVVQDQFEKVVVNKVEQREVVATPPGENIVLNLKNSETEKEISGIDDGKMSLDEVQANIAGSTSIDEAIAEALAKEQSISAIGKGPGVVQENVQKSCESESSVSHVTETKVTPLVRREGDVKMDVEEITMLEPVECPGIETTDDAIDKAAVQPNTSAVPSDSPLWPLTSHAPLAAMGHTTRSIKEEPAYPSQVCVCPPGKAKQCDGVPSIRGIMNGEQPSMEDMPETSAIERRMSTELSSEALTAC